MIARLTRWILILLIAGGTATSLAEVQPLMAGEQPLVIRFLER